MVKVLCFNETHMASSSSAKGGPERCAKNKIGFFGKFEGVEASNVDIRSVHDSFVLVYIVVILASVTNSTTNKIEIAPQSNFIRILNASIATAER